MESQPTQEPTAAEQLRQTEQAIKLLDRLGEVVSKLTKAAIDADTREADNATE